MSKPKRPARFLGVVAFAGVVLLLTACEKPESASTTSNSAAPPPEKSGEAAKWTTFKHRDRDHNKSVAMKGLTAAFAKDIDKLQAISEEYLNDGLRTPSGEWHFEVFYGGFAGYSDWNQQDPERYFPKLEAVLQQWIEKYPQSPAAPIALASLYTNWAWHERSSDWASNVKEDQWKRFAELLEKATTVLKEHEAVSSADPFYHRIKVRIGLGQGWPLEEVLAAFRDGQKIAPDYWEIYNSTAYFQLPRWHGENHQQWHEWLVGALKEAPGITDDERDEIYAHVVLTIFAIGYNGQDEPSMFEVSGVDWERLKRGADLWLGKFPKATRMPSRFLFAAMYAEDFDKAREIVKSMNYRYDGREWLLRDDPQFFGILKFLEEEAAAAKEDSEKAE